MAPSSHLLKSLVVSFIFTGVPSIPPSSGEFSSNTYSRESLSVFSPSRIENHEVVDDVLPDTESAASSDHDGPYINPILSPNVVAVLGKEARLKCYVTGLGNKTISWIRHRDIHLLTVGRYTYTSDQRFSAHHIPLTHFWQLRIRAVTPRDEGFYECQVSTTPPRGHRIELRVVEPHTEVLGGPDMHVDRGSTINLTCVARFSPAPPPDVEWRHNNEIISYDSARGGVSVVIEKGTSTTSHLLIQRATATDSGEYRCEPSNSLSASINLHIHRGKNPDAWQTSSGPPRVAYSRALSTAWLSVLVCKMVENKWDL